MTKLTEAKLGFGSVRCIPARPEVPETREQLDDGTHIHMGSPAREAFCEVDFRIECSYGSEEEGFSNVVLWSVRLAGDKADLPFSEVEAEAARLIAPMLRDVADSVEKQVVDFDESRRMELGEA
jgi:hypothetical protein